MKDLDYIYIRFINGKIDLDTEYVTDIFKIHEDYDLLCNCKSGNECLCSDRSIKKRFCNWEHLKNSFWRRGNKFISWGRIRIRDIARNQEFK
jgi:hypothetical protein